jgi:predicted kinase
MKHELIILQGIQGSGKTTWAKNWVNEDSEHRVRFNRDDIRNMLGKYWVPNRESLINAMYESFLNQAMLEGYDIVLDNMNLNQKALTEIKETVKEFNKWISLSPVDLHYDIKYQTFFDTPLEECISRDAKRENSIGEEVIRNTYNKYKDIINENL